MNSIPMGISPHELQDWLKTFDSDPMWAFHACPNNVYSEIRRFGYVDVEHDLTDKGRDWIKKYNNWKAMVSHCAPALVSNEAQ